MSSITLTPDVAPAALPKTHYANVRTTVMSWLFTVDHKRIAILYLISITVFFAVGGLFASLIRIELLTPKGDFMTGDTYNKVFTLHGVIMIFFFLIPSVPATLGNFALPIMIGAKDLAFPKINLLSWWLYMLGGVLAVVVLLRGGLETGWTFYPPYSTTFATSQVTIAILAAFLAGFSSIFTGLNFIVTVHKMRAPGMTWFRMPLFVWAHYATSIIQILGTPVVAITLVLVAIERVWGVGIFNPQIGGDPVLFQHLFWFYSHPAVYVMILPGMGVVSEVIPCFSRKRIFGYEFIAFSSMAIAIIGFLVWGHHLYVSTQSTYAGMVFSLLTFLVAVPSAIKVFNWTATMYKGEITFEAPMIYALGFIGLFLVGGLTGLVLASMANDIHFHDTYFVVAHFHYVMVGGMVMAYMCGLHYWWPKMTGRMYPAALATIAAILVFVGFNFTFFPQFILGFLGMPRRYHSYVEEFQILNIMSTMGASVLGLGYGMQPFYLLWSLFKGKPAGDNPWGAKGLEWQVPSPPPTFNFPDGRPVVIEDPYAYTIDVKEPDSVAQH
ncbi:MAG: cytochrome c oxidase subunit I [Candidatus Hydrogenedentes bacterium]|nr:cytochrome c oxidase subunit I [Candidatus Hydrogenedentota bacterium]